MLKKKQGHVHMCCLLEFIDVSIRRVVDDDASKVHTGAVEVGDSYSSVR